MQPYGSLENYILSMRNQSGLSQRDLAFLLDERKDRVGYYEQQAALPNLRNAIGMGFVFDEPTEALFAGVSESIRQQIAARAGVLLEQMSDKTTEKNAHKLETLSRLRRLDEDYTWRNVA